MRKYNHYFKALPAGATHVDVYRVIDLWQIGDPCLQHALKKVLVAGGRGHKSAEQDVQEAIDSLLRWQEMRREEQDRAAESEADANKARPAPADGAPSHVAKNDAKTFMFGKIKLKAVAESMCNGCFAVEGGSAAFGANCERVNSAARVAGVLQSAGGCGAEGVAYVRA